MARRRRGRSPKVASIGMLMHGLFDVDFGPGAFVLDDADGLTRRISHGDIACRVDHPAEFAVVLNLSDEHTVECRLAGAWSSVRPRVGSMTIMPPGHRFEFSVTGRCRILAVRIPAIEVAQARRQLRLSENAHFDPNFLHFRDPGLTKLMCGAAGGAESPGGPHLAQIARRLALLAHARGIDGLRRVKGGLPSAKLRRVVDHVDRNLSNEVSLASMAVIAGLSVSHFARTFASVTGIAPHRFVIHRRVDRAIALLGEPDLTLTMIAHRAGFAQRSHLARAMRQVTGLTPEAFRRSVLPRSP